MGHRGPPRTVRYQPSDMMYMCMAADELNMKYNAVLKEATNLVERDPTECMRVLKRAVSVHKRAYALTRHRIMRDVSLERIAIYLKFKTDYLFSRRFPAKYRISFSRQRYHFMRTMMDGLDLKRFMKDKEYTDQFLYTRIHAFAERDDGWFVKDVERIFDMNPIYRALESATKIWRDQHEDQVDSDSNCDTSDCDDE